MRPEILSAIETSIVSNRKGESNRMNSIKSILARVQSLKENGFDETDGTQVNQVAKALAEIDIRLVDAEGNFRNFGTVMDEIGAKWDTLTNRQKMYVATTVAGLIFLKPLNIVKCYSKVGYIGETLTVNDEGNTEGRIFVFITKITRNDYTPTILC